MTLKGTWRLAIGIAVICGAGAIADSPSAHPIGSGLSQVRFVGCAADGQVGPIAAPVDTGKAPRVLVSEAKNLAYYATDEIGVLAPRGWHCIGLVGSNGLFLVVTPDSHTADEFLASRTKLLGPAIQLTVLDGQTSGRFDVAEVAARLFPNQRAFVERVLAEGVVSRSDWTFGPYPHDLVQRKGRQTVLFTTPAYQEGTGTRSWLGIAGDPIVGLGIMPDNEDHGLVLLDVRLHQSSAREIGMIIGNVRRRYERH